MHQYVSDSIQQQRVALLLLPRFEQFFANGFLHFHEACGIRSLKIDIGEQESWLSELIEWTKK